MIDDPATVRITVYLRDGREVRIRGDYIGWETKRMAHGSSQGVAVVIVKRNDHEVALFDAPQVIGYDKPLTDRESVRVDVDSIVPTPFRA